MTERAWVGWEQSKERGDVAMGLGKTTRLDVKKALVLITAFSYFETYLNWGHLLR
jgi:hypothetical protein